MKETYKTLVELLKKDDRLVVDGKLAKNKVIELALQLDVDLLKMLRSSKDLNNTFFQKVDDVLIFDKVKFQSFVSNKQFLPDSFTEYKNKIGLVSDKQYLTDNEEVVLDFPYKDCILEGGQTKEDSKRNEVFWNETLALDEIDKLLEPKVLTNFRKYDNKGDHTAKDISSEDNLIIKGNNLLALHSLKKTHKGKIKLIYIDPPYNTGSDSFQYNDKFNHSTWLTFIKNRLSVADSLLRKDGAIFIHIDYIEQAYLKVLCDEVFGRESFVQIISVKTATPAGFKVVNPGPVNVTEFILMYAKPEFKHKKLFTKTGYQKDYKSVIENPKDDDKKWKIISIKEATIKNLGYKNEKDLETKLGKELAKIFIEIEIAKFAKENAERVFATYGPHKPSASLKKIIDESKLKSELIISTKNEAGDYYYVQNGRLFAFYSKKLQLVDGEKEVTQLLTDMWSDVSWDSISNEGGITLKNGKKPEALLKRIIELGTDGPNDIVLDFQLGSGTTCAVAHKMGRKYIGIEQLNYGENDSIVRLKNVVNGDASGISKAFNWRGGGSFVYAELAQANQLFIDKIQDSNNTKELFKVWDEMKKTAFLSYKVKPEEIDATKKDFESLAFENQQKFLISTLDKNMLYVPYSEIEDRTYKVSKEDIALNNKFYGRD